MSLLAPTANVAVFQSVVFRIKSNFMKIPIVTFHLFFFWATSLNAQLKEFEISEMPRPDVSIIQANTEFPDDALIIVYSSLDNLSFRSSMGAIDKQNYNTITGRYELLIKPIKQMLFVGKPGFLELKVTTLNPNAKEVYFFKIEEKKTISLNQTIPGRLTINSVPTGANISLNGIPVATTTPFTGELNPGTTRIQLSKAKYYPFDTIMNIQSSISDKLEIKLKPSTLWLNIKSNPSSAIVELDGKVIGNTPLYFEQDLSDKSKQGERILKLSLADYSGVSKTIELYPSIIPLALNFNLTKLEGAYKIESSPVGAQVFINGNYIGQTPLQGSLPFGEYSVEFKMEDYTKSTKQLNINSQKTTNLKENLIFKKQFITNLRRDFEEGEIVKDVSGNSYKTVIIGDQFWMAENLKTERYSNGELIPNVTDNYAWSQLENGAWCSYNNVTSFDEVNGKLYNFYSVADSRNICPIGWHIPTIVEWNKLIENLGGEVYAINKMKGKSADHLKFLSVPSGYRNSFGIYSNILSYSYWWTKTKLDSEYSWYYAIGLNTENLIKDTGHNPAGFSVRCIKDSSR